MALVTHGTTLKGFKDIMAGKGKSIHAAPWTVSDMDGQMYFFDVNSVAQEWGNDLEDEDEKLEAITNACNQSYESARLQYAVNGQGGQVVVLVCDIPDELLELDLSCHGDPDAMPTARAISCCDFNPAWIVDIRVGDFDVWDCPPVLEMVWGNCLFNQSSVPDRLAELVENGIFEGCYDAFDYSIESVDVQEFIQNNA